MRFLLLSIALTVGVAHAQDAWQEARSFSAVSLSSPPELAGGIGNSSSVPMTGSALNIGIESNYLLPATPDAVVKIIRNVTANPTEDDIPISNPAAESDFKTLTITDSSMKTLKGLNLSVREKQLISAAIKNQTAESAWRMLLLNRAASYQTDGLIKAEPYVTDGGSFQPAPEFVSLLKQRDPVLRRFMSVINEIMTAKAAGDTPPVHYWANEKIQRSQNFALGAVHSFKAANSWQLADCTYYSASSYYLSITLYEFWPVTVGGQAQTYVWRGDYVISPSVGYTKGIERMAAENIMLLEVKGAIKAQINQAANAR